MSNIIDFSKARKGKVSKKKVDMPMTMTDVDNWVESDIAKLMNATKMDKESAIKLASDFYYTYPALIEHVRSEEFMATRR